MRGLGPWASGTARAQWDNRPLMANVAHRRRPRPRTYEGRRDRIMTRHSEALILAAIHTCGRNRVNQPVLLNVLRRQQPPWA